MRPLCGCFLATVAFALGGCGGGEEATPEAATPVPTPAPLAAPTGPATLHHVVIDEWVAAPDSPLRSPLPPASVREGRAATAYVIAADGADEAIVSQVSAVLGGAVAAESDLALVEWTITWGEDGIAGSTRAWGVCVIPCTIEETFVATSLHHPADPITSAAVHYAGRPHAKSVEIDRAGDAVRVRHGDVTLWSGAPGEVLDVTDTWEVSPVDARGRPGRVGALDVARKLAVLDVVTTTVSPTGTVEPVPSTIRMLPVIKSAGQKPPLIPRAVEGRMEQWPWPSAERFEGTASVKPDPSRLGVRFVRQESRVEWVPSARQAGEFDVEFPLFTLSRNGVTLDTMQPFPDGARVYASISGLDSRLSVASRAGKTAEARAGEVVKLFEAWDALIPLPAPVWGDLDPQTASEAEVAAVRERSGPPIAVLVHEAAIGTVVGGPGGALATHVVSPAAGEQKSVAIAFARAHLGAAAAIRSEVTIDWQASIVARVANEPDPSIWARVFREAGDDVEAAWSDHLRDPANEGAPGVAAFLGFVAKQLPSLADRLRRELALRTFAVAGADTLRQEFVAPLEVPDAAGDDDSGDDDDSAAPSPGVLVSGDGSGPTIAVFEMGPSAPAQTVDLVAVASAVPPVADVEWVAALVSANAWEAAVTPDARTALLGLVPPTQTTEDTAQDTPAAAPSQAPEATVTLAATTEDSVLIVIGWGVDGWERELALTPTPGDSP